MTTHVPSIKGGLDRRTVESDTALLLIDVVTDFDFEDGEQLSERARSIVDPIARLKSRARSAGIPVIYVNDNFGNWKEDFERQVLRVMKSSDRGRELIQQIQPKKDDLYVLKPQRSGFYETPLAVLLSSMEISSLILGGITTDICVLFTAHDAYMRGFKVSVPSDCTAAADERYRSEALNLMARVAQVDIRPSTALTLAASSKDKKN